MIFWTEILSWLNKKEVEFKYKNDSINYNLSRSLNSELSRISNVYGSEKSYDRLANNNYPIVLWDHEYADSVQEKAYSFYELIVQLDEEDHKSFLNS